MAKKNNKRHQKKGSHQSEDESKTVEQLQVDQTQPPIQEEESVDNNKEIQTEEKQQQQQEENQEQLEQTIEETKSQVDSVENQTIVDEQQKKEEEIEESVDNNKEIQTEEKQKQQDEKIEQKVDNNELGEKKEEEEEEEVKENDEQIKVDDGWDMDDMDFQTKPSTSKKTSTPINNNEVETSSTTKEKKPKTKIIKKIIRKPKAPKPTKVPTPHPQTPPPQPQPQTGGWGWFSSISSAVTSTINSIARLDEEEEEEEEEEFEEIEVEVEINSDEENDSETILNAIDSGVFKTADIIADSLYFAGSLLSSGFKSVQENANIENVKGLAQGVAHISMETSKKATNSEMYEKGQKMATSVVDSSVDVLESVGQKAYSMFSAQIKSNKLTSNNNNNNNNNTSPTTTTATTTTTTTTTNITSSPPNQSPNQSPKETRRQSSSSLNSSTSSSIKSSGGIKRYILPSDVNIFDDNQFESNQASEYFKIQVYISEIEKVSVESTMKIHQMNRKLQNTPLQSQVTQDLSDIKELFDNYDETDKEDSNNNKVKDIKSVFFNNDSSDLQQNYNEYFEKLQEYLPSLRSKSSEASLCRGLENIYQLLAISLQLLSIISQSLVEKKSNPSSDQTDDNNNNNSNTNNKEFAIKKSNEILFLITKYKQDINSLSNIMLEILKSKQNPNSRKLINTLNIETNNATSHIDDTKGGLLPICQISYLNEIKNIPKKTK